MGTQNTEEESFFEKFGKIPLLRLTALIFSLPLTAVVIEASIKTIQLPWASSYGHYAAIGITVVAALSCC
jgi:hypothetical protein